MVDFLRSKPPLLPFNVWGEDIDVVQTYNNLGVHLDNKFDWSENKDVLNKRKQSMLFFLRKIRSL